MKATINKKQGISSLFSLKPLVAVLQGMIAQDKPGARRLYEPLLQELAATPGLLEPLGEVAVLHQYPALVDALLSTIFSPSTLANDGIYAISFPFRPETVFASPRFKEYFLNEESGGIVLPDKETGVSLSRSSTHLAYDIILRKFYGLAIPVETSSIHPFCDPATGLTRYFELKLNAQFVDVLVANEKFVLPSDFAPQHSVNVDELKEVLPLENFRFEGLFVIDVVDITSRQVIAEIKNTLLNLPNSSDVNAYNDLQAHVQTLIGLTDVQVWITPFFSMNDFYLYAESYYKNSLLLKSARARSDRDKICRLSRQRFHGTDSPLLFETLNGKGGEELVSYYQELEVRSLILCPLKSEEGQLLGLLEISSAEAGKLKFEHVLKLQPGIPLFSLALGKTNEVLELQINKIIKEHFTAIQPAVEWKFVEAAFNYLQHKQGNGSAKMANINFEAVYPLYGAIDIRNSSVERNNAIQLDLMEQLTRARSLLEAANKSMPLDLLKELQFRIDKYIAATSDTLLSDDEMVIYDFLQIEIDALFRHLQRENPKLRKAVDEYFAALDPQRNIVYQHRKEYEDSITRINDVLDRFIDQEQRVAQEVFPHYFERYITDGIEFNIYLGQSLAPLRQFDTFYIKNLKLWQLALLAKAARLTYALEKKLSLPLQTTQLLLTHSIPLTISFRRKERKFDVDGAYNIHYEIIKKRIDKVHLKDSDERLTQPGRIAIVYSQQKELNEYLEFIEYLQHEGLLTDTLEHVELEDTQGISGLKALRIGVNLDSDNGSKFQISKITAQQLLRK
ncbi:hypothetical protein V9K67_25585 [Paraflavisolibacter sp. H34]|uniref:hypothetical protein n=1 Tax=Huijunlia imazamoxiresistens TaxID=3127457 RepID=UPI003018EBD0